MLTEAGKRYYEKCRALNSEYQNFLKELESEYRAELKIGFTGAFENRQAIMILRNILAESEDIHIDFCYVSFDESLVKLLSRELDIALGIESTFQDNRQVAYEILYKNEICIICSFDHPLRMKKVVTIDDIRGERMILLSEKNSSGFYRAFMEACRLDDFQPNIVKEVDSFDELITGVSIGDGIAIVSKDVVRETEVCVLDLEGSNHQSNYVLAYLKDNRNPFVRELVDKMKLYNFR